MKKKSRKPKKQSTGVKHDAGKPRLSLNSPVAFFKLGQVMTDGAQVYDDNNWRGGFKWTRLVDSAQRHLSMWNAGMDKDPDSGRSNLAHCMACIMMLLEFEETHKHLDDRYKFSEELLLKLYPPKQGKKNAKRKR